MSIEVETAARHTWHRLFLGTALVGLALVTATPIVLALMARPGAATKTTAEWIIKLSVIVIAVSLIGVVFTEKPGKRRRFHLQVLAGFIALTAIVGTLYALGAVALCGMNWDAYIGWGCRGTSIYWRDPLLAIPVMWAVAGGLAWLALRAASNDSA